MLLDLIQTLLLPLLFTPCVLGLMLGTSCCCAEPGCEFFSDSFNRADSDDPGAYTEVSGDWDISSNTLVTSDSGAVLLADAEHPSGDPNIRIIATVTIPAGGGAVRVLLDYVDSDNYWFGEIRAGTGAYVRIYERVGGSNTLRSSVSISRDPGEFSICASINGTVITVGVLDGTELDSSESTTYIDSFSSPKWAMGTGAISGETEISQVTASVVNQDCPACPQDCNGCLNSAAPSSLKVVVVGIIDDVCSDCTNANATYYLPFTSGGSTCNYGGPQHTATCGTSGSTSRNVFIGIESSGQIFGQVTWVYGSGALVLGYLATAPETPHDCFNFDDFTLAFNARTVIGSASLVCDGPDSYMEISSPNHF